MTMLRAKRGTEQLMWLKETQIVILPFCFCVTEDYCLVYKLSFLLPLLSLPVHGGEQCIKG